MKKVLFRADASPSLGIGDLMSMIHLSAYFSTSGWEPHFMIRPYPAAISLMKKNEIVPVVLPEGQSIPEEVNVINQYCDEHQIDLLFFTITEHMLSNYRGLRSDISKACVSFDGEILENMQLVVDWDPAARSFFQPLKHPRTRFLLGPKYVILPQAFYADGQIKKRRPPSTPKKVLIAMGGADEHDFTSKVAMNIASRTDEFTLNIIVGSGYPYTDQLTASLSRTNIKWKIKQNITNMREHYLAADVGIGAGGLTASELVATRTPAILIATYEHQVARCRYFHEKGYAAYIGFRSYDANKLFGLLKNPPHPAPNGLFNTQKIVEVCNEL